MVLLIELATSFKNHDGLIAHANPNLMSTIGSILRLILSRCCQPSASQAEVTEFYSALFIPVGALFSDFRRFLFLFLQKTFLAAMALQAKSVQFIAVSIIYSTQQLLTQLL